MENDKIHDYTDAYLESYLRALDKTHKLIGSRYGPMDRFKDTCRQSRR